MCVLHVFWKQISQFEQKLLTQITLQTWEKNRSQQLLLEQQKIGVLFWDLEGGSCRVFDQSYMWGQIQEANQMRLLAIQIQFQSLSLRACYCSYYQGQGLIGFYSPQNGSPINKQQSLSQEPSTQLSWLCVKNFRECRGTKQVHNGGMMECQVILQLGKYIALGCCLCGLSSSLDSTTEDQTVRKVMMRQMMLI